MSAAPFLAALLAHALPGLRAIDTTGRFLAFLPGARALLPPPPDPAEAELLAAFAPAPAARAALLAGAAEAWGPGPRLLLLPAGAAPPPWARVIAEGALRLHPGPVPAAEAEGRILLLTETPTGLERHTLLAPAGQLPGLLDRLAEAAAALAPPGARIAGRRVGPALASLGLLGVAGFVPRFCHPAGALPQTGPNPLRLLLGCLPPRRWRLELTLDGTAAGPPALFLDGLSHPAVCSPAPGGARLVAEVTPAGPGPLVLGLAWPAPPSGPPSGLPSGPPSGPRLARIAGSG